MYNLKEVTSIKKGFILTQVLVESIIVIIAMAMMMTIVTQVIARNKTEKDRIALLTCNMSVAENIKSRNITDKLAALKDATLETQLALIEGELIGYAEPVETPETDNTVYTTSESGIFVTKLILKPIDGSTYGFSITIQSVYADLKVSKVLLEQGVLADKTVVGTDIVIFI